MSDPKSGMQKVRIGVVLDVKGNWFTSGCRYRDCHNSSYGTFSDQALIDEATSVARDTQNTSHAISRVFVIELELPFKPQTIRLGEVSSPDPVPTYNIKDFSLPGELDEDEK